MVTTLPRAPKLKPFPVPGLLLPLLQNVPAIMAVNWLSQGMRGMGRKELSFRLLLEATVALVVGSALGGGAHGIIAGCAIAHTLDFVFNGQLWVCGRYARGWSRDVAALTRFVEWTAARLRACGWLDEAVLLGSFGGPATDARSDVDLRLIFPDGALAWVRVNLLLLRLRSLALILRIPLDLYAYDAPSGLRRFDQREPLLLLLDRRGRLAAAFPTRARAWP